MLAYLADADRGRGRFLATIHPSYLLRIQDEGDKRKQYGMFVDDLALCREALDHAA